MPAGLLFELLNSPTGIESSALLGLCECPDFQTEERSQTALYLKSDHEASSIQNQLIPDATDTDTPQSYWQIVRQSGLQKVPSPESSAEESEGQTYEVSFDSDAFESQPHLSSPLTLHQRITQAGANSSMDQSAIERYWFDCLSVAETPTQRIQASSDSQQPNAQWVVVADYSRQLIPWWNDIRELSSLLSRFFGKLSVRQVAVSFSRGRIDLERRGDTWPAFGKGTKLLVASDCGLCGDDSRRHVAWQVRLKQWQSAGVNVLVLLPDGNILKSPYPAIPWGDYWADPDGNQQCIENVLACLSTVQWCSWRLLRYWRRCFGGPAAVEYQISQHPGVWCEPDGCLLQDKTEHYRTRFTKFSDEQKQTLLSPANRLRDGLAHWVVKEEFMIRECLGVNTQGGAEAVLAEFTASGKRLTDQQLAWLYDLAQRQDERFWQRFPELKKVCIDAGKKLYGVDADVPESLEAPLSGSISSEWLVCASASGITVNPKSNSCVIARIHTNNTLQVSDEDGSRRISSDNRRVFKGANIVILGSSEQMELQKIRKPSWAIRLEQNSSGLVATLNDDRRLHWCASGGEHEHLLQGAPGAWIDEEQVFNSQTVVPTKSDSKATNPFTVRLNLPDSPEFNLCWIPPGEYSMGSPEDELGRYENEQQHQVLITRGFWMMETPCTQALWQSVTGENPSEFRGSSHPVENVSWDDIHEKFLPGINELMPDMAFRLPTEAEWEYACRAGTDTAFYSGDMLGLDKARYLGHLSVVKHFLDDENTQKAFKTTFPNGSDINWAEFLRVPEDAIAAARAGDESWFEPRRGTCEVKSFQPNARGLYDMHGNVWEWCADALGRLEPYGAETRIDPMLGHTGRARVLRGSSWDNFGWFLRSACRSNYEPGYRNFLLGFRLVAGSRPGQPDGEEHTAASVAERNVRSVRGS